MHMMVLTHLAFFVEIKYLFSTTSEADLKAW